MIRLDYKPEICHHCGQTMTYLLPIDRGSVEILKAIATRIRCKGVNIVHPRKEMEISTGQLDYAAMVQEGLLTSNMVGNLSRPRFHGLIAAVRGNKGSYCMTTKGAEFLHGAPVPKFAVISKANGHNIGYWMPERYQVTIRDFRPDHEFWTGINFSVIEGRIVEDVVPARPRLLVPQLQQRML
ncbi:MAG: hypothetical protein PHI63_05895 [Patescibacteria group bacterium]|nr:hypothetical protein [Patescibacteria group bacterium]